MNVLEQLGFFESAVLVTPAPEAEYPFKHILMAEVAYASLLKSDRHRRHRIAGLALEETYPDRQEGLAGHLAHHFAQAGDGVKEVYYASMAGE